jgi:hypothetical protein
MGIKSVSAWVYLSTISNEEYKFVLAMYNNMHNINKVASTDFEKFWKIAQHIQSGRFNSQKGSSYNKIGIQNSIVNFCC